MPEASPTTLLRREILEIPQAVARCLEGGRAEAREAGQALKRLDPRLLATVARGSSDHAAGYLKYAVEIAAGVPVASIGPSVASIYGRGLRLEGAACVGLSQSGQSPDLVAMAEAARAGGALTIAITNDPASALAGACARVLALRAGPERSVAATKTFAASVAACLALLAEWRGDRALREALARLPEALGAALAQDWSPLMARLAGARGLYVIGRGPGLAIAREMALKLKEVCGLHAEAHSAAEVLHGPAAIVGPGLPVLALAPPDAAQAEVVASAARLAGQGGLVLLAGPARPAGPAGAAGVHALPAGPDLHPLLAPLVLVAPFYAAAEALARQRGLDPDAPSHLRKITRTR